MNEPDRDPASSTIRVDPRLRYEALFEQTNDAVVLFDLDYRIVAVNQRTTEIIGLTAEEMIGKPASTYVAPEEAHLSEQRMRELREGRVLPLYERTFVRANGERFPAEVNIALIRDDAGRPRYYQSILRDISKRRRSEQALRHLVEGVSNETGADLLRKLVRSLARAFDVRYAVVGEVVGKSGIRMHGRAVWTGSEFAEQIEYAIDGTPCETVVRQGERLFCPRGLGRRYPKMLELLDPRLDSYLGIPLPGDDGVIGHLALIDCRPMRAGLDRSWVLDIFAARAAAELQRIRVLRALRRSERRYRRLIERIPAVVYVADLDPETPDSYVGPGIEELTGYTPAAWTASTEVLQNGIHPGDREQAREALAAARDGAPSVAVEYRFNRADGREIWIRDEATVIRPADRPAYLQGLMTDVTRQKQLEEDLLRARKLESLGLLAGGVAHDFNNLLMSSLGNLSLAKYEIPPDEPAFDLLVAAEKAMLRAKGLTRQLMALAKGGAPIRQAGPLRKLIEETTTFATRGAPVRVELGIADDLWPAEVDQSQIAQVIENLVINAVHAMPGGGTLLVEAVNHDVRDAVGMPLRPGPHIRCSVSDEGAGIDADALPHVFDPYYSTKEDGSGLGLATSYAIVRRHDGHITIESQPGRGTRATFYLPALPELAQPRSEPTRTPACGSTGRRVLVMDDDPNVRDIVASMLGRLDYRVEAVEEGAAAVESYRRAREEGKPFDAVIVDLTVAGGMGGREATERLLEVDPEARVIVSSGYSEDPVMASYGDYGFQGCMAKPYRLQELRETLDRVLDR